MQEELEVADLLDAYNTLREDINKYEKFSLKVKEVKVKEFLGWGSRGDPALPTTEETPKHRWCLFTITFLFIGNNININCNVYFRVNFSVFFVLPTISTTMFSTNRKP